MELASNHLRDEVSFYIQYTLDQLYLPMDYGWLALEHNLLKQATVGSKTKGVGAGVTS
ncbi:hypothetical protein [Cohnella abietis]|uniref:Uncharacterized protein n=1 Tax=Cohnella abietis TaxID=2507935 RepID=A0A3T1DBC1_9BACL|nr:hypothetical protein [Cohnella abietis]BBI35393.1 hypothetical protein KCTCHS21_47920 [Cohnella abietis]